MSGKPRVHSPDSDTGNLIRDSALGLVPETLQHFMVQISGLFVGEGWHLTLGALFMIIVIFLPGGLMEGVNRVMNLFKSKKSGSDESAQGG